ncbi:MAG: acylphosphatase [Caldilineaceae bacterium]
MQGVYYRQSTVEQARLLGLSGWVANRPDGSVRVCAEGDPASLRRLLEWLQHGPPAAHVEQVLPEWSTATGEFHGFSVRG